jgi:hypothetical protein
MSNFAAERENYMYPFTRGERSESLYYIPPVEKGDRKSLNGQDRAGATLKSESLASLTPPKRVHVDVRVWGSGEVAHEQ